MTSQIAVFNLECVAIASDSVLTISDGHKQRTLATSEKLVDLGPAHKIMVLASGEARFMKVPWAVLLREWSIRLSEPLPGVGDYAKDLVEWLRAQRDLFGRERQESFFAWQLFDYYASVRRQIERKLSDLYQDEVPWDEVGIDACVTEAVQRMLRTLRSRRDLDDRDEVADAHYVAANAELIDESFEQVFGSSRRNPESDELLKLHIPALILGKDEPFAYDSTVALIGYGAEDLFPGHQVIDFHGMVDDRLRYRLWEPEAVAPGNSALIRPLAQTDAIQTFLLAYHQDVINQVHATLDDILDDLIDEEESEEGAESDEPAEGDPAGADDPRPDDEGAGGEEEPEPDTREAAHRRLTEDVENYTWNRFVAPMLATVDALPRTDMARVAEALVGIQALRAASMGGEPTVGGPIDVAVISRADGVQWVRRKELTLS